MPNASKFLTRLTFAASSNCLIVINTRSVLIRLWITFASFRVFPPANSSHLDPSSIISTLNIYKKNISKSFKLLCFQVFNNISTICEEKEFQWLLNFRRNTFATTASPCLHNPTLRYLHFMTLLTQFCAVKSQIAGYRPGMCTPYNNLPKVAPCRKPRVEFNIAHLIHDMNFQEMRRAWIMLVLSIVREHNINNWSSEQQCYEFCLPSSVGRSLCL